MLRKHNIKTSMHIYRLKQRKRSNISHSCLGSLNKILLIQEIIRRHTLHEDCSFTSNQFLKFTFFMYFLSILILTSGPVLLEPDCVNYCVEVPGATDISFRSNSASSVDYGIEEVTGPG